MRKIYITTLLLLFGLSIGFSQNLTLSVTPESSTVAIGDEVTIDVVVQNFTDVQSLDYILSWDVNLLEYVSVSNTNSDLPGFSTSISEAPANIDNGRIRISWVDFATFAGYDLDDDARLFTLTLRATSNGTTLVEFSGAEATDSNFDPIGNIATNSGNIIVGEDNGGGSTLNEDPIELGVGNGSGDVGQQVCIPVRIANFENMESLQFSMSYDEALLDFVEVKNFGLPGLSATNFGTPPDQADGVIRFSWNTNEDSTTVNDNTTIFEICFDLLGTEDASASISIESTPLGEEAIRATVGDVGVDTRNGTITISGDENGGGTSEDFRIYAPTISAAEGEMICLDIRVDGFQDIAGIQYSMTWNSSILQFTEVKNFNSTLRGFGMNNFGLTETDDGLIRLQWNDDQFNVYTLPDETVLYQICFEVVGTPGQSSQVAFSSTPVNQLYVTASEEISFTGENGRVNISGDPPPPSDCDENALPICISKEMAGVDEEVCVSVTAQNFEDLVSAQFTISFDRTIIKYERIEIEAGNALGLTLESNFSEQGAAGIIAFLWNDPTLEGVNVPDDTELFRICFTTLKLGTAILGFSDVPTAREVSNNQFNLVPFNGGSGEVEVKNENNCTAPSVSGEATDILCVGESVGSVRLNVAGGNNNFDFAWDNDIPQNTPNLPNLPAGTYTVTVTDKDANCNEETTMSFTISEPDGQPLTAQEEITGEVICFGDNNGAIDVTASGGTGELDYEWGHGPIIPSLSDLAAGSYMVTIMDENGCTEILEDLVVPGPTQPLEVRSADVTDVNCSGDNSGTITLEVLGGTADYTFAWSGGLPSQQNQTGVSEGNYAVTVTDANDCSIIFSDINVLPFTGEIIAITDSTVSSIVDGGDGAVDITVGGGSGNLTYSWEGPDDFTAATEDLTGLDIEGIYTVTVTDTETACVITGSFSLTLGSDVSFGAIVVSPDCSGESGNSGSIIVEITGGIPPLTYAWDNTDQVTKDIFGLDVGIYTLTVTDDRGNMFSTTTIEIVSAPEITVDIATTAETCSQISDNGSVSIEVSGGTGDLTWQWGELGADNQDSISNVSSGNYAVTITDTEGCMVIDTAVVAFMPDAPRAVDYEITDAVCGSSNGAIAFSVSCGDPGYTVRIEGRNTSIDTTFRFDEYDPRVILNDLPADTYDVTLVDANELSTPDIITVAAPGGIESGGRIFSSTQVFAPCDGEIRLNAQGGSGDFTYLWSNGAQTGTITGLCQGVFIVTITDSEGCTEIDSFNIQTFNANGVVNNPACASGSLTGSINVTVTAGQAPFTYMWSRNSVPLELPDSIKNLTNIEAGIYTVTITESSGVSITRTFEVDAEGGGSEVSLRFGADYNGFGVSCAGASDAVLVAQGRSADTTATFTYAWVNAANDTINRTSTLTDVGAGIYEVLVTGAGCTASNKIVVTEPPALTVSSVDILDISCAGDQNGEAMVVVDGGSDGRYTYEWSHEDDNNFPTAIGLSGGSYTVTITDENDCSTTETFDLVEPELLSITFTTIPVSATTDGSIEAIVSGGTPSYEYIWQDVDGNIISTGMEKSTVDKLPEAGTYTLTVEDMNGCRIEQQEIVPDIDGCLNVRPVITPNGDGKNDVFSISCVTSYKNSRLEVYSRWGQLVYAQNNYDNNWSGQNVDGEMISEGVYYYVLLYEDFGGESRQQKGTVTVLFE